MAHWAGHFYERQGELTGCYGAPIHPFHHELADWLRAEHAGQTVLEVGAGGGQFAVAAALAGLEVTALDLRPAAREQIGRLAREHGAAVRALTGDFYTVSLPETFDTVCYWDGFGIGTDDEQRQLLGRVRDWLAPGGRAFIDIFTPWYWAHHAGYVRHWPEPAGLVQTYGFDADACRMTDTYSPAGEAPLTQSLRCYSPADLRLLLAGTGLDLLGVKAGGRYDPEAGVWHPDVPLGECMTYVAVLGLGAQGQEA